MIAVRGGEVSQNGTSLPRTAIMTRPEGRAYRAPTLIWVEAGC
jgi:hypothetical protein